MNTIKIIKVELLQLFRNTSFSLLMFLLLLLMTLAVYNTHGHVTEKRNLNTVQKDNVKRADDQLMAQIDSLSQGLATYEDVYTLPTSGVRLSYNNHRIAWLPVNTFSLLAMGQSDIYSNYKKIVLYFNDSYEMATQELISPIEQLFGQLDLAFVWVYLLPLIILLISFNIISLERETARLPLIASQPIKLSQWLLIKIGVRFFTFFCMLVIFTYGLLFAFGVPVIEQPLAFGQLAIILLLYTAFWFFMSFLVNLSGFSSGKSLILLTSLWVLFVFLIPSTVNQVGKELHPLPSRLELINNHQTMYNEMEKNLDGEMEALYKIHPDWLSENPVIKDMSNSTGWNIDYLAKQYIAQLKHQPVAREYEKQVDLRNEWFNQFTLFSPSMILQTTLTDLAGTSNKYYRSFLRQAQVYAQEYRMYVFKRLFNNYAFTTNDIKNLSEFKFDRQQVKSSFLNNCLSLILYLIVMLLITLPMAKKKIQIK